MLKLMPMSSSSLKVSQCLRRYQNKYITKEFPEVYGKAAERGTILHALLQETLKGSYSETPRRIEVNKGHYVTASWLEYQTEWANCVDIVANIQELMQSGWDVFVERELAADGNGRECGWWARNCYMRAKVDALLVSPDKAQVLILDWKTGKSSSVNEYQLPFIGLVLVPLFGCRVYGAMDYMIDQNTAVSNTIEVDRALPKYLAAKNYSGSKLAPVIDQIKILTEAHVSNSWPCNPAADSCRWCVVANCIHKG